MYHHDHGPAPVDPVRVVGAADHRAGRWCHVYLRDGLPFSLTERVLQFYRQYDDHRVCAHPDAGRRCPRGKRSPYHLHVQLLSSHIHCGDGVLVLHQAMGDRLQRVHCSFRHRDLFSCTGKARSIKPPGSDPGCHPHRFFHHHHHRAEPASRGDILLGAETTEGGIGKKRRANEHHRKLPDRHKRRRHCLYKDKKRSGFARRISQRNNRRFRLCGHARANQYAHAFTNGGFSRKSR